MPVWSSDGNVYENEALAILGMPNGNPLPSNGDGPIINVADTPVQRSRWWEGWRRSENVEDRRDHPFDSTLASLDQLIKEYDSVKQIDEKSRREMRKTIDESLKKLERYSPKKDPWEGLRFSQDVEGSFQQWYAEHAKNLGLSANPDDPEHYYDWRGAYKEGAEPDESGHWPSKFKREGHPNLIIDGIDTRTGQPVE